MIYIKIFNYQIVILNTNILFYYRHKLFDNAQLKLMDG